jgi:hypothetical protein
MAKRLTIESCLNEEPHKPHTFRPAIFGLGRKVQCEGISNNYLLSHRHKFRFAPVHSDYIVMTWRCKVSGCRESMCVLRSAYNFETIGAPLDWFITQWDR